MYGCQYFVQIVRKADSVVIFKKDLAVKPKAWNIFNDQAIFWIDHGEKDNFIYVVHLNLNCAEFRIEASEFDRQITKVGFKDRKLYLGSKNQITIFSMQGSSLAVKSRQLKQVPKQDLKFEGQIEIDRTHKLHGFFENLDEKDVRNMLALVEIDNNLMNVYAIENEDLTYGLFQLRRNFNRVDGHDLIQEFQFYIDHSNTFYAAALKESGNADIYYNYCLCSSSKHIEEIEQKQARIVGGQIQSKVQNKNHQQNYSALKITKEAIMLRKVNLKKPQSTKLKNIFDNFKVMTMPFTFKQRIGFQTSQKSIFHKEAWDLTQFDQVADKIKLFSSIIVVGVFLAVCHRNIISFYDFTTRQWTQHYVFEKNSRIKTVLKDNKSNRRLKEDGLIVFFEDNTISFMTREEQSEMRTSSKSQSQVLKLMTWKTSQKEKRLKQNLSSLLTSWREPKKVYISCSDALNSSSEMYLLYKQELYSLAARGIHLNNDDQMINLVSVDGGQDLLLYSHEKQKLRLFKITVEKFQRPDMGNQWTYKPVVTTLIDLHVQIEQEQQFTAAILDFKENQIILFSQIGCYAVNLKNAHITKQQPVEIASTILVDEKYAYSLRNKSQKSKSGVYIQKIKTLFTQKGQQESFKLENAIGGVSNYLEYIKQDERIAYQSDYKTINIIPIVHRNVINFFGMQERSSYLAFKETKEQLIALDYSGHLTTWSKLNGRIISRNMINSPYLKVDELRYYQQFQEDMCDFYYRQRFHDNRVLLKKSPLSLSPATSSAINRSNMMVHKSQDFEFKLIQIDDESSVSLCLSFIHATDSRSHVHHIYFSQDLTLMLERTDENIMIFMNKTPSNRLKTTINHSDSIRNNLMDQSNVDLLLTEWQVVKRIYDWSLDINELPSIRYLFTPNLELYVDYDLRKNEYQIKNTLTGQIECVCPPATLSPRYNNPSLIMKQFMWTSNDQFKVINPSGMEKLVSIYKGEFRQIGYCKIPMYDSKRIEHSSCHFYTFMKFKDTYEKLLWRYQHYFSAQHSEKADPNDLVKLFCKVDYGEVTEHGVMSDKNEPIMEFSFTYLHWKIAEHLHTSVDPLYLQTFSVESIKELCLNIFPTGDTIINKIYSEPKLIKEIYGRVKKSNDLTKDRKKHFSIPFLKNLHQLSPIHQCMQSENFQALDVFLQVIKDDDIDNHIRSFIDKFPDLMRFQLPSLDEYISSRVFKTETMSVLKKGKLNIWEDLDCAIHAAPLWADVHDLKTHLLQDSKKDVVEIEIKVFDLPLMHDMTTDEGKRFNRTLAEAKNLDVFSSFYTQTLIDYKWPLVRFYTILLLFVPSVFQLIVFTFYSNLLTGQFDTSNNDYFWSKIAFIITLYLLSGYFLSVELRQMKSNGWSYFLQIWNYSDLVPPILIPIVISVNLAFLLDSSLLNYPNFVFTLHAIVSFVLWIKFLYFMRIFKMTGYLINMISNVLWDMKIFLFIFFIVLIAFGEAFLRLSHLFNEGQGYDGETATAIPNYAYSFFYSLETAIGNISDQYVPGTVQPITFYIFIVLSVIVTNVVLLNLLISVISAMFARITDNQISANYQERAQMISENSYLVPRCSKRNFSVPQGYLIFAKRLLSKEDMRNMGDNSTEDDTTRKQMNEIQDKLEKQTVFIADIKEKIHTILAKIET